MESIVFLERGTVRAQFRRPAFEHRWTDYDETDASQIAERLSEATIAIVNKLPLRRDLLSRLPRLRLISIAATGFDNIDLDFCRERRIAVTNVRGYARSSVAEHVLMMTLALSRNLISYRADIRAGAWQRASHFCAHGQPIRDLHATTLGIIGHGTLGRAVEELARAFGMRVLISEHKGAGEVREGRTPFAQVLGDSDVVTLHAPLTPETRHMIGRAELASMRSDALLINCARGALVDEAALLEAVRAGVIAGAGVDVLSVEPPGAGNPLLEVELPNLIITPHVAWASRQAMQTLADQLVDNLEAFVRGEPVNLVTGDK